MAEAEEEEEKLSREEEVSEEEEEEEVEVRLSIQCSYAHLQCYTLLVVSPRTKHTSNAGLVNVPE